MRECRNAGERKKVAVAGSPGRVIDPKVAVCKV
jgi:hypothetical protein